jgi:hypothetical protein
MAAKKLAVSATLAWDDFIIRGKTAPQFLDDPLYVATMDQGAIRAAQAPAGATVGFYHTD